MYHYYRGLPHARQITPVDDLEAFLKEHRLSAFAERVMNDLALLGVAQFNEYDSLGTMAAEGWPSFLAADWVHDERLLPELLLHVRGYNLSIQKQEYAKSFLDSGSVYGYRADAPSSAQKVSSGRAYWNVMNMVTEGSYADEQVVDLDGVDYFVVGLAHALSAYFSFDEKAVELNRQLWNDETRDTWEDVLERQCEENNLRVVYDAYTYNYENSLDQDVKFTVVRDPDGEYYYALQAHVGCDARGGFAPPLWVSGEGREAGAYLVYPFLSVRATLHISPDSGIALPEPVIWYSVEVDERNFLYSGADAFLSADDERGQALRVYRSKEKNDAPLYLAQNFDTGERVLFSPLFGIVGTWDVDAFFE